MLRKENRFSVDQTVYFLDDGIVSGKVKYIRHFKDDIYDGEGSLIIRSLINTEYFVDKWRKEDELVDSVDKLI